MAITLGVHASAGSSDGNTAPTPARALTTGSAVMAVVSWGSGTAGDATLADNAGNTWVKVGSSLGPTTGGSGGYNCRGVVYKCESCTGHASYVLTATRAGEYPSVAYQEYKGTGITVEAFASANDAATPFSSGNVGTPAANGAGLFGGWIHNANGSATPAVNAPMTVTEAVTNISLYYPVAMAAGLQATAAAFSADFTSSDGFGGTAVFGAFLKESSGPAAYTLPADSGSYALTGTAATLKFGRALAANSGSYALTGTAANLLQGRKVVADSGSYALTGAAATLTYTPAGSYLLTAEPGSFVVTGSDATLTYSGGQQPAIGAGTSYAQAWEAHQRQAKTREHDAPEPKTARKPVKQAAQDAPHRPRTAEPAPTPPIAPLPVSQASIAALDGLTALGADLLHAEQAALAMWRDAEARAVRQAMAEEEEAVAMLLLLMA